MVRKIRREFSGEEIKKIRGILLKAVIVRGSIANAR